MTVTCPEGHRSEATDYCDTCGAPIGAGAGGGALGGAAGSAGSAVPGAAAGAQPGPATPGGSLLDLGPPAAVPTVTCPHCGGVNVEDALFCEACGYDFTTGAAPMGAEPEAEKPEGDEPDDVAPEGDELEADEQDAEREPVGAPAPEDFLTEEPIVGPPVVARGVVEQAVVEEPAAEEPAHEEPPEEEAGETEPADEQPSPATPAPAAHARPRHTPPSRDLAEDWVVEVWVDPDWYAVQQTDEACPSPGVPDIVVVRRNVVLVGRPSGSLGLRPDVDAGADSAVSRRHAQLTSDGRRWWIEDLGSSNGTFVGVVGEPVPTEQIPPGQRVEIDRDDRIYVGAWTRLVIRQATAAERAGQG